jgi:hypothetical protein
MASDPYLITLCRKAMPVPESMVDYNPRYKASGLGWCKVSRGFGYLTVVEDLGMMPSPSGSGRPAHYLSCVCACGREVDVRLYSLRKGTRSCGCLCREINRRIHRTHGQRHTRIYNIWSSMRQRCLDRNCRPYSNYGGRGITICQEWDDFTVFRAWALAHGYQDDLTIERVDNNGNYEPANCVWVPKPEQARNKRNNRLVIAWGQTKSVIEWSEDDRCQVSYDTLWARLMKGGWDVEKALICPPGTMMHGTTGTGPDVSVVAWGEGKTLDEWTEDRRCQVDRSVLKGRLGRGWTPERAIAAAPTPNPSPRKNNRFIVAWGESKLARGWSEDDRCMVREVTLRDRLARGWAPERAISQPGGPNGRKRSSSADLSR